MVVWLEDDVSSPFQKGAARDGHFEKGLRKLLKLREGVYESVDFFFSGMVLNP